MLDDYINSKPTLETERLVLRPLRREDAKDLSEWMGDEALYLYWGKRPGKADLNPELLFEKPERPARSFHWGIAHKVDNKVIGEMWVYLIERSRKAKVAFRLARAYQGRGLMAEALSRTVEFCFEKTELRRLWSDVHVMNAASCKTLERAGFKREKLVTGGRMVSVCCDYYVYGIEREEHLKEQGKMD